MDSITKQYEEKNICFCLWNFINEGALNIHQDVYLKINIFNR